MHTQSLLVLAVLCSSMCMSVGINVAGVTTMFELLSDPKHELHSHQGVAA